MSGLLERTERRWRMVRGEGVDLHGVSGMKADAGAMGMLVWARVGETAAAREAAMSAFSDGRVISGIPVIVERFAGGVRGISERRDMRTLLASSAATSTCSASASASACSRIAKES